MYQTIHGDFDSPSISKDRISNSTSSSEDSCEIQERSESFDLLISNIENLNIEQFGREILQKEIGPKIHRKVMNWLLSVCWDRDIQFEALWMTIMIYYRFKSKRLIKKSQIQKLIYCCLLLSCKAVQPEKLSINEILKITNHKYSSKEIIEVEGEILQVLDFDIWKSCIINEVCLSKLLNKEEKNQFLCLSELFMISNSDIFWKKKLSQNIIRLIKEKNSFEIEELKSQLDSLIKTTEGQLIFRKYSSKLDTYQLLKKIERN